MLRVYEGASEAFGLEPKQEVLYENTGYSKYFATSFPMDILDFETWKDFENRDLRKFKRIEALQESTVYIDSLLYVRLCIGKEMRMWILCI